MVTTPKTKPPVRPRRIMVDDDLPVIVEGVTYHPHAGEWVEFSTRPSIGLYLELAAMGRSEEGIKRLTELMTAWDWTDDAGRAYPNPPTVDAVGSLPLEEFGWLISNAGSEPKSDPKVLTPASTEP